MSGETIRSGLALQRVSALLFRCLREFLIPLGAGAFWDSRVSKITMANQKRCCALRESHPRKRREDGAPFT